MIVIHNRLAKKTLRSEVVFVKFVVINQFSDANYYCASTLIHFILWKQ